jgi:hypothetical protein
MRKFRHTRLQGWIDLPRGLWQFLIWSRPIEKVDKPKKKRKFMQDNWVSGFDAVLHTSNFDKNLTKTIQKVHQQARIKSSSRIPGSNARY